MTSPDGQAAPDGAARAPRPTWLVTLGMLNFVFGALALFGSVSTLRDPGLATRTGADDPSVPFAQRKMLEQLAQTSAKISRQHAGALRARAVVAGLTGLLFIYGAATALTRDGSARHANMAAAWAGIANQGVGLLIGLPVALAQAEAAAPILAAMAEAPDGAATSVGAQAIFVGVPAVMALVGVAYSLLLLRMFGGPRGRALDGIK